MFLDEDTSAAGSAPADDSGAMTDGAAAGEGTVEEKKEDVV
jgi:hypothetical protein